MRRAIVIILVTATVQLGGAYGLSKAYSVETEIATASQTCWVADELRSDGDCTDYYKSQADAAWEGLSSAQQSELLATGETGQHLDELIINFREALDATPSDRETHIELTNANLWQIYSVPMIHKCMEDEPCWDCRTMGNLICGVELPRTN